MSQQLLKKYSKDIAVFQEWIKTNQKLPQSIGKFFFWSQKINKTYKFTDQILLLRFLKTYDFEQEKAQKLLLVFLKMRKKNPKLFSNRTLAGKEIHDLTNVQQIFPIRKITNENNMISVFRILDPNPKDFNLCDFYKLFLIILDAKFMSVEDEEKDIHDGDILVCDMKNFHMKQLLQSFASPFLVQALLNFVQESTPMKLVQIHFITASHIFMRLIKFVKPFLRKEISEAINFHQSLETLHEMIGKDSLPEEYGGSAGKCDDLNNIFLKSLLAKRLVRNLFTATSCLKIPDVLKKIKWISHFSDYLLDEDNWMVRDWKFLHFFLI